MRSRRVIVTAYGGPDVLHVVEADAPETTAGQVRIRAHAVGVAFGDLMRRQGVLAPPSAFHPGIRRRRNRG